MGVTLGTLLEVTLYALRVISLAVNGIALTIQVLRSIVTGETFTHLTIHTISIPATLRAMWYVAQRASPSNHALAHIG
jgi:hypothetical protein